MRRLVTLLSLLAALSACSGPGGGLADSTGDVSIAPTSAAGVIFQDVTGEAGLSFHHFNAATAERLLPETMGSGVAFFDYDNNGYPDIFFVNGSRLDLAEPAGTSGRLYRNLGNGRFEDATAGSGLDESFFGMGVAVGDYQNDGWNDLLVTGVDQVRLYRNLGDGRFRNVTPEVGLDCPGFGSSAAFLDYDLDGFLDVFVGRYVVWSREGDIPCSPDGIHRTYCTPEVYPGISCCLLKNREGRDFVDVSDEAGISGMLGKALGVAVLDYNDDGWPDVAVANDTVGNFLLVNQKDGTFADVGVDSGMAYSESGAARGGMGIDSGDIDRDGRVDIVIGNFSQEMAALFRGIESGYFVDDAAQVGIGIPTLMTLAFGTLVEDFDNDGWLDILLVNGHIEPDIAETRQTQAYRQPPQLFRNLGQGKFQALKDWVVGPREWNLVARGLASGDYDRDGDLDFVVTQNGGPAFLFRNDRSPANWLRLRLIGSRSNRQGYGARVRVIIGDVVMTRYLVSGRSYLSASEPLISLGLGEYRAVDRVEILWPSGVEQAVESVAANQVLEVIEPAG